MTHSFPKLHNAAWPGLVGKEAGTDNPPISLDRMLDFTAAADVDGVKFDGIDLFLFDPHTSIDADDAELEALAEKVTSRGLVIGSLVAPVWEPTGGGSAMGNEEERTRFLTQVRKACGIGKRLREMGVRPYGLIRIDSACGVEGWSADPEAGQAAIADTFRKAADIAEEHGERLAAEGEICWGGMHSWKRMTQLLEMVDRPGVVGFQADMAHTLLYTMGYNAPEDRILPDGYDWQDPAVLDAALTEVTKALRPWTIDFHVAQNDATVFGSGSHDKTGRHCLPKDPNGKLDIARHAGFWLRGEDGQPTGAVQHLCWDGCMFPNSVMEDPQTWNDILGAMIAVRDAHGWS
ncbi:MAG: sugar phosphate isomerase/epimerase family protein [Planctomycetota bacterium]